ncbi:hypothetical protein Bca4012_037759 [Brassica carinata]|uniref:Uncharacterized protein n=1 Tax=Brassica carinata TaxID=52824 RepID=A0A8X7WDF1_BRACI|nr:hypothetical protein Bca52824_011407 [Brassica carinata]
MEEALNDPDSQETRGTGEHGQDCAVRVGHSRGHKEMDHCRQNRAISDFKLATKKLSKLGKYVRYALAVIEQLEMEKRSLAGKLSIKNNWLK